MLRRKILQIMSKTLYIIFGSISLVLGTIGIFLPLLPTTPFYLLTAWLYMRGSKKLYDKVMNNKYFGTIVKNFQKDKSIPLKTKIIIISMLWGTILFSAFLIVSALWLRLILFAIAIGVTIHILSFKTRNLP
ncbi:hypothetical protein R83H12_01045 [Fibrobacteria bacterium R8-3-H12]